MSLEHWIWLETELKGVPIKLEEGDTVLDVTCLPVNERQELRRQVIAGRQVEFDAEAYLASRGLRRNA